MPEPVDRKFYDRADAFIFLANEQGKEIGWGKVSAMLNENFDDYVENFDSYMKPGRQ